MKKILVLILICITVSAISQVFNRGFTHESFKNLLDNGITYIKTGNAKFDSIMIKTLDQHWKMTSYSVIERYKEPDLKSTAFFITTMTKVKEHFQDRKNQKILVLMPAKFFDEGADYEHDPVDMNNTLGYMAFNGFHDIIAKKDEHRFLKMMIVTLNEGISLIKENQFFQVDEELNKNVANAIYLKHKGLMGLTLIIHRDQAVKQIDMEKVKASGIKHRLLADVEYNKVLEEEDPNHYALYFANNKFTELSLIRIATGEIIYTKHFREDLPGITKKEYKMIFKYFK